MAAAPRLSPEQWAEVRRVWEGDPRPGYAWIIKEADLDVSANAVRKKALIEGWTKSAESSAGAALKGGKGVKRQGVENAPNPPPRRARKYKGGEEESRAEVETKGGEKSSTKVDKPKGKTSARKGSSKTFKKNEGPQSSRSGKGRGEFSRDHGSDDGSRTMDDEDSSDQWIGTTDIDIQRPDIGRPPEYKPEYAQQVFKLCLLGATDEKIADFFDVSVRTIQRWKIEHPEFCHWLKQGKTAADAQVAFSMFQRAVGISVPKVHISTYKGKVTLTDVMEHYPPDVGAGKFWLTNRQADQWKSDPEPPPPDPSALVPNVDELDALYAQSMAVSQAKANVARDRRERMGLFTNAGSEIDTDAALPGLSSGGGSA